MTYGDASFDDDEEFISRLTLSHDDVTALENDGLQSVGDGQTLPVVKVLCKD